MFVLQMSQVYKSDNINENALLDFMVPSSIQLNDFQKSSAVLKYPYGKKILKLFSKAESAPLRKSVISCR